MSKPSSQSFSLSGKATIPVTARRVCIATQHTILSARVDVVDTARNWGVIIDSHLSLSAQVAALSRSRYFQLRQVRPIIRSLTMEAAKTIAQAFVSCRLDYCNSLLYGISDSLIQRLQSVQNAAACLVTV